jgi:tagatose 1,6-diphosphate aldolase
MMLLKPAFRFIDPGVLRDRELELITPRPEMSDEFLRTCAHPLSQSDVGGVITPQQLNDFFKAAPYGRQPGNVARSRCPAYHFWMRLAPETEISIAGTIGLRVGRSADLEMYLGHIGYHVFPPARGNHYAERACRLLFPLARAHGLRTLWITCNPDNAASRRTCERLGGELIDIVALPANHVLYQRGERSKCRYRIAM